MFFNKNLISIPTRQVDFFSELLWFLCCLVSPSSGQVAFSFPPPSQLEPLLPDMEDDDEAEGKEGRENVGMATGEMEW